MRTTTVAMPLPFCSRSGHPSTRGAGNPRVTDCLLALHHAQIPFLAHDRLLLLYGHQLVFHLGLHAAIERAIAGESVLYIDGANTFTPFVVGRLARARRRQPQAILSMIHVARAFSGRQMERLICDCLESALNRYQARTAILSGLFETFYDQTLQEEELLRSFGRMMESIAKVTQRGGRLLCLCPPVPVLTCTSRRCLEQLRGQADRVIRVRQEPGIVRLEEEGHQAGHTWEVAATLLDDQGPKEEYQRRL